LKLIIFKLNVMKTIMFFLAMFLGIATLSAQTRTAVKKDELPKAVTEDVTKNYHGWNTIETYKVDTKGETTYAVAVKKAETEMDLVYDEDGRFLRVEPHKAGAATVENPADKSATSPSDKTSTEGSSSSQMPSKDKSKN
jgi:hypothetical protein